MTTKKSDPRKYRKILKNNFIFDKKNCSVYDDKLSFKDYEDKIL